MQCKFGTTTWPTRVCGSVVSVKANIITSSTYCELFQNYTHATDSFRSYTYLWEENSVSLMC